ADRSCGEARPRETAGATLPRGVKGVAGLALCCLSHRRGQKSPPHLRGAGGLTLPLVRAISYKPVGRSVNSFPRFFLILTFLGPEECCGLTSLSGAALQRQGPVMQAGVGWANSALFLSRGDSGGG